MQGPWLKKTLKVGITFILIITATLIVLIKSEWGRSLVKKSVNEWLSKEYQLNLQFDSMQVRSLSLGWELSFRELRWNRLQGIEYVRGVIRDLKMDVNPWGLVAGGVPVSAIAVNGAQLQVRVDFLNQILRPSPQGENQIFSETDLSFADIELELIHGGEEPAHFTITAAVPAKTNLPSFHIKSPGFNLLALAKELLPLLKERAWDKLDKVKQGRAEQLDLNCLGFYDCRGSVWLKDLHWESMGSIPGMRNLALFVELQPQAIDLRLPGSRHILAWPSVYSHPVPIKFHETRLSLRLAGDDLEMKLPMTHLEFKGVPLKLEARTKIPLRKPEDTHLRLSVETPQTRWEALHKALPDRIMSRDLNRWLTQSLSGGQLRDISVQLDGEVRQWPRKGRFEVQAQFEGMKFQYQKAWPSLDQCQGIFKFRQSAATIEAISCMRNEITVSDGTVSIPQFSPLEIQVQAKAASSFRSALTFLKASPLHAVGKLLDTDVLQVKQQETTLQLNLLQDQPLQLRGQTLLSGIRLMLPSSLYTGTSDHMSAEFDQEGLKNLQATLSSINDKTDLRVQRDAANTHLDIQMNPLDSQPRGFKARLRATPAAAPDAMTGTISSFKFADAAVISMDHFAWQGGHAPLLKLRGAAQVNDFGKCLGLLKQELLSKGGNGTIHFDLSIPLAADEIKNLSGPVDFNLVDGHLHKLPNIATTVINVANLKVFGIRSDSLSYVFLKGKLQLANSVIQVKDGALDLGAVEIHALGAINYGEQTVKMDLQIIPDLGSPAAAVAIGTWNPLVGITLFGLSKFHGNAADSRLNRAISQTYRLVGPTAHPKVELIKPMDLKEILRWSRD